MKKRNRFPPGWNDARVQRVLDHYETQSDMEAVAEDEAAYRSTTTTVMKIPVTLRSGRQSAVGETTGELMDARPNLACNRRRDGRVRAAADA